ncbi:hypothetical protein AB0I85_30365 [Micromonospora echinofusca]|uniref:hypothetical protein n=1 Tax=Micromonospora echinofusca TaxID=47858 RepID=UPI0034034025
MSRRSRLRETQLGVGLLVVTQIAVEVVKISAGFADRPTLMQLASTAVVALLVGVLAAFQVTDLAKKTPHM